MVIRIVGGWVDTKLPGFDAVLRSCGYSRVNDARKHIVDSCTESTLLEINIMYPHKDKHLYTWTRNDLKSVIDPKRVMNAVDARKIMLRKLCT